MHTILVIGGGLVALALFVLVGRFFGGDASGAVGNAVKIFIPVWLVGALVNMWVGVSRAGYSVAEEAPIFAVVFALPVLAGLFIWWKFS
ncbi:hypothetical protein [Phreatobacter stygius]|uniref:Transmembrane protein n=1 Tax=Phreatobacter stygius TaxID=1940610 RepID=A0A4D7AVH4_9HYPH|nr:hypothetical protein [Phreatobacter stygius]QCI63761.1 hypothetical protein E8M01_05580 [Phreatobacter stygius]